MAQFGQGLLVFLISIIVARSVGLQKCAILSALMIFRQLIHDFLPQTLQISSRTKPRQVLSGHAKTSMSLDIRNLVTSLDLERLSIAALTSGSILKPNRVFSFCSRYFLWISMMEVYRGCCFFSSIIKVSFSAGITISFMNLRPIFSTINLVVKPA